MSLLSEENLKAIADAMFGVLKESGKELYDYSRAEAGKFAHSLEVITKLTLEGQISEEEARLHLELQKHAAQTVLTSIQGISLILAQRAISAGLGAVSGIVNGALGFALI